MPKSRRLQAQRGYEPQTNKVTARPEELVSLPVKVRNLSSITLQGSSSRIGLSYHLLDADGALKQYDNMRRYFDKPLPPDEQALVDLPVLAPPTPGDYVMELDVVWEGVTWFKQKGSKTVYVNLKVR